MILILFEIAPFPKKNKHDLYSIINSFLWYVLLLWCLKNTTDYCEYFLKKYSIDDVQLIDMGGFLTNS